MTTGALFGCRCNDDPGEVLARLESMVGLVERDFAAKPETFLPAENQASFHVGDAVRTDATARATLRLSDGSELALEPSTQLRFLKQPPGETARRLDVSMGEVTLQTGEQQFTLETKSGRVRIEANSKLRLQASAQGTRFEVVIGAALFNTERGDVNVASGGVLEFDAAGHELATATATATASASSANTAAETEAPISGTINAVLEGTGASARPVGAKQFTNLEAGPNTLAAGTTLRLRAGTSATVQRGQDSARLEGAGEFVVGGSDWFVRTLNGAVNVNQAARPVRLRVPGGSITVEAQAQASVRVRRSETDVKVNQGTVTVDSGSGTRSLSAGEEAVLDSKGRIKVTRGRGPESIDLAISAGDSVIVHDAKPPTAIGIAIGKQCPAGGVVELTSRQGQSSFGTGTVNVLMPAGSNKYRLRCLDEGQEPGPIVSQGTVSILHDAGTRQLAKTPPPTLVDTDGRNYTVLYQTLMPKLTVRWPDAPKGSKYQLHVVAPGGKTQTLSSSSASYTFPPGSLKEGTYQLQHSAASGARSRPTTLSIRFDNAAPTASLTAPREGGFARGAQVFVSGTALPGWSVSANGVDLPQDDQHRFSGNATAPTAQRALVIRFAHPERGAHLYLRRAAGSGS